MIHFFIYFKGDLMVSNDMSIIPNRLFLTRTYPSRFSLRSSEATPYCFGWQDNLHMALEYEEKYQVVSLRVSGVVETLYGSETDPNLFESERYQVDMSEWSSNGVAIVFSKAYEISYAYDSKQGCVKLIEMFEPNGRSVYLNVECSGGKIRKIESSDQKISIRFSYSQSGCLTSVSKYLRDDGGRAETVLYDYDNQKRLVSATGPDFVQKIMYDSFGNVRSVVEQDAYEYTLKYADERGIVLRSIERFEVVSNRITLDYGFTNHDDGFIDIEDRIKNRVIRKLFDLEGRLVLARQDDVRTIKLQSDSLSSKSAVLENGQVLIIINKLLIKEI